MLPREFAFHQPLTGGTTTYSESTSTPVDHLLERFHAGDENHARHVPTYHLAIASLFESFDAE